MQPSGQQYYKQESSNPSSTHVAVKMLGKLVIVLEELVGAALSLTDMALVVILIEVLMKLWRGAYEQNQ